MSDASKPDGYYTQVRTDVLAFLPERRDLDVLELGCGAGQTGRYLKERGIARRVVGVELDPGAAAIARQHLDVVHVGDLGTLELSADEQFDLVLCADVVEHLVDPWRTLERVTRHLRRGGELLTSTPNIRHWSVLADLIVRGKWEYRDDGILDRTHLRFFTRESIQKLHADLGHEVKAFGYTELTGKRLLLDRLTLSRLRDFLCGQHVVRSVRP